MTERISNCWFLKKIPRILHCYWGGDKLSYLRYLTIVTFKHYNPDWKIILYQPTVPVMDKSWITAELKYADTWDDYGDKVRNTVTEVRDIDFSSINAGMSEVHRSDYLRWQLLSTIGGLWADMDILFFRPVDNLLINTPENGDKETVVCINHYGHSIGFMMGSENNSNFAKLAQESLKLYNSNKYQCMGSELFNRFFPTIESINGGINLGMEAVYHYNFSQTKSIFGNTPSPDYIPHAIGVHWYGGSALAGKFLTDTNGGINHNNSLISRLIKKHEDINYRRFL